MCDWVLSGLRLLVGLDLQAPSRLDLVLNKVVEMISCTNESKPLTLPWGRTLRLDSGVRERKHVVRGESNTRFSWYFVYNRSGHSGTLVRQRSAVIVTADADFLPRALTNPLLVCGSGQGPNAMVRPRPKGLLYLLISQKETMLLVLQLSIWWSITTPPGATVHVYKDRCWFKTYESLNDGSILHMGNESTTLVHRRGCVDLRFSSGKIVSLLNVLHVPNIRKNLVSSSVLNNYGYKQVIESNKFVLSKHGVFIGFGYLSNHMFRLNIVNDNIGSAFMSTSKLNDSILWHARLGHVHFKRMQDMSKDGLIPAFDMDTEKCKTCMLTKITKKPFQNVKRETEVLELIHSDLCDLHATPSLGNKKYFVTFIDDAFRFCYVYLLISNDEALNKFKVFKTEVELQQGSQIKRFRTVRGGEYMDTLYFKFVGIIHEMTAPYTPQQNGISERKNKVPKEMVNSMLSYSGLSQGFWGEAMLTTCYLLNRVPNKKNRITPYKLYTKRKLNLNYLRVWGCRAVVRLSDLKLKTLGERGIECIFVGYAEHSKAFRFYVIKPNDSVSINSIIESRDAIFDENRFSSVPRPSLRISNGTEDIGGSVVVPKEVTKEVVQQPEPELRKKQKE
ncbi:zinc finger, CCHC-type containing protein [Tanacetum coccineum]